MSMLTCLPGAEAGAALAGALLAGHAVSDFWLQNEPMIRNKNSLGWLAAHAGIHFVVVGLLAFLFCGPAGLVAAAALAIAHGLIDRLKSWLEGRYPDGSAPFVFDQLLHLSTLAVAFWWLGIYLSRGPVAGEIWMGEVGVVIAGYAFCGHGAGTLVAKTLARYKLTGRTKGSEQEVARGAAIGRLERILLFTLVLLNQWGALGFVLAAKSIARFKDLDERDMSEYYLVGTLLSTLLAVGAGMTTKLLLGYQVLGYQVLGY